MDTKRNFQHFINIGVGTIGNILLGLITTPVITRLVDTSDYGALSMFNTYVSMAVMILCLGLDQSLIRFYYDENSIIYKRSLITKTAWLSLTIAVFICIVTFFVLNLKTIVFDFKGVMLIALLLYTLIQLFLRFSLIILRVEYLSKFFAFMNVLNKAIYLVSVLLMMMFIKKKNNLFILVCATIISSLIPLVISILSQRSLWKPVFSKNLSNIEYRPILFYGMPFIFSMSVNTLFEALGKIMINHYCDYSEVGIYASAVTIVNVFTIIQTTFNTIWAPMSIEHYTRMPNDKQFFYKINEIITILMFIFGLSLIAFKEFFVILLGEKYRTASHIVPFLIFQPIMYTISETTSIGIDFKKKTQLHIVVATVSCAVNACGNLLLVPSMGGQGAAISTCFSYIVFFSIRSILGLKNYNYFPKISKMIIIIIITTVYAFYSSFFSNVLVNILIYIFCIFLLLLLYRSTAYFCVKFIVTSFMKRRP